MITALHISIPVLDMSEAIDFYTNIFGLQIVEESNDLTQLCLGQHLISLRRTEVGSESLQSDSSGMIRSRHFGFRVGTAEEVNLLIGRLKARRAALIQGNAHRPGVQAVFCSDPSGNQIEIYFEGSLDGG